MVSVARRRDPCNRDSHDLSASWPVDTAKDESIERGGRRAGRRCESPSFFVATKHAPHYGWKSYMGFAHAGQSVRSFSRRNCKTRPPQSGAIVERMEPRQLLSAALPTTTPATATANAGSSETITLTPSTTYQTIQGWLGIAGMQGTSAFQQTQALNMLVPSPSPSPSIPARAEPCRP